MLEKCAAHLVRVVGDNGVQTWPCAAPVASGDDGDAVACLLRSELVARDFGRQLTQLRCCARHADHGVPAGIMICLAPGGLSSLPFPLFPPLRLTSFMRPNGTRIPASGQVLSRTRTN